MSELTRRQALAVVATAPVLLHAAPAAAESPPRLTGDAAVLEPVLRAELIAEAAYRAAASARDAHVRNLATRFGGHETEHVQALTTTFQALGAPRPAAPRDAAELDAGARELGIGPMSSLRSADELLARLAAVEERLVGRWVRAHRQLHDLNLVQTATQVLACQAQHLVVLRDALERPLLPNAFEAGRG